MDFKTDENLPTEVCELLRKAGHDALSVLDQQLGGSPDLDLAAICKAESRAIITLDLDFSNIITYPPSEYPGIIVLRTNDQSKPAVLDLIRSLIEALTQEDPGQRLWIIEKSKIRIRGE